MQVLQHAWYVINNHPNVVLDNHPATAVKKVGAAGCLVASVRHQCLLLHAETSWRGARHRSLCAWPLCSVCWAYQHLTTVLRLLQAIHKQSFKERQRGAGKQQQHQAGAASKMQNTKRSYAQMALAAEVGAAEEGEAGFGAGVGGVPREVTSQVFEALAVWPASLEYLATEASSVLMLPKV